MSATSLLPAALARALSERDDYRLALFAALDQLHEAWLRERRLREQIAALREEVACRMGVPKL